MASPDPLYKIVIRHIAEDSCLRRMSCDSAGRMAGLTVEMQFDVCLELYRMALDSRTKCHHGAIDQLEKHLSTLNVFLNFLQLGHKRIDLHKMFEFINGTILLNKF